MSGHTGSSPSVDIAAIRAQIPSTQKYLYLNSGWQGPSPRTVTQAVQDSFAAEAEAPTAPPLNEYRLAIFRRARQAIASLIGASPHEVSLQQNTTEGINIVLAGLRFQPGDEIITCSYEHSSVIVPAYITRDRAGATLKIVRLSPDDSAAQIVGKFEEALTPALKLIFVSHISYATGQRLPIRELAELAHARGGYLLLDAAQSAGQLPLDVGELGCDFCAFPGHKWLLGPAGTGALYLRRELIPLLDSAKASHHVSSYYNFKDRFQSKGDTIDKFELTTVSVPLLAGLNAAIDFISQIGLEVVEDRALSLARYATERLAGVPGVRLVSAGAAERVSSGLVSFSLPNVAATVLTAYLWERSQVVARTVPDAACTRLSLHVFNTEEEVDAAVDAVASAAANGVPEKDYPSIQLEADAMTEL